MIIISVVGARPNFMKIAPFVRAIDNHNNGLNGHSNKFIHHKLIHTGQHYDLKMSDNFFIELGIPLPDYSLGIGSGLPGDQLGRTMIEFEKVLLQTMPDWVVVVGDVNATLACSIVAKRHNINVCHIESGLRSWDMSMPEEINRLVTDRISDLLLTPDAISSLNLLKEGELEEKIVCVGNVMIDTLESNLSKAKLLNIEDIIVSNRLSEFNSVNENLQNFVLCTFHRPFNVDSRERLVDIVNFLVSVVSPKAPVIWPIHPRTLQRLIDFKLIEQVRVAKNVILLGPLGYLEMLKMNSVSQLVLTDSGGLQEECCVLGTPALIFRENTERPITLRENGGVCVLVGSNISKATFELERTLGKPRTPFRPQFWDGFAAERCLSAITNYSNV